MKSLLLASFVFLAWFCTAGAQQPTSVKKPPVGIPADAKLFKGKWYRVYLEKCPWPAAKAKCASLGGQLVIIPDAATWEFVKTLSPATLWMGATDEETEGVWKWVDGTPVTFQAWIGGGADNSKGGENYLTSHKGGWNDAPKDGHFDAYRVVGYICEWKDK